MPILGAYDRGRNAQRASNDAHRASDDAHRASDDAHNASLHNQRVADYEFERKRNTLDPRADREHELKIQNDAEDRAFKIKEREYKFSQTQRDDARINKIKDDQLNDWIDGADIRKSDRELKRAQNALALQQAQADQDRLTKEKEDRLAENAVIEVEGELDEEYTKLTVREAKGKAAFSVALRNIVDGNISDVDIDMLNNVYRTFAGMSPGFYVEDVAYQNGDVVLQFGTPSGKFKKTATLPREFVDRMVRYGKPDFDAGKYNITSDIAGGIGGSVKNRLTQNRKLYNQAVKSGADQKDLQQLKAEISKDEESEKLLTVFSLRHKNADPNGFFADKDAIRRFPNISPSSKKGTLGRLPDGNLYIVEEEATKDHPVRASRVTNGTFLRTANGLRTAYGDMVNKY